MQLSKSEDSKSFTGVILVFIAFGAITFVALGGCNASQNERTRLQEENTRLLEEVNKLKEQVSYLREESKRKDKTIKKQYDVSLRKYAAEYRERISVAVTSIDDYRRFAYEWGRNEFRERFPEERHRRFNRVKARLDAIVDHVRRYRPILEPFANTLNGRLNRLDDQLLGNNEDEILREFEALREGVDSQIGALETQINRLGDQR